MKDGETFAVFTPAGTIRPGGFGELGIYHGGTRFISTFELAIERRSPLLLGSTVRNDGVLVVHLASPDIPDFAGGALDKDALHLASASLLVDGAWHARLELHNYSQRRIAIELAILYGADFRDVFEVRGMKRERRGSIRPPIVDSQGVTLGYDGLDGRCRLTRIELSPVPRRMTSSRAELTLRLEPGDSQTIELRAVFGIDHLPSSIDYAAAYGHVTRQPRLTRSARVATNNERFDAWMQRSASDVQMMTTTTAYGDYPYAGVPWFSTPFGRDGLITAYERLWLEPNLARGVLGFLSATQATTNEPERDAEPGKIIHEARMGEMAALGEIPFGRYYGSVDATPLFVILAYEHWRRTADRAAVEGLWPSISRALAWLETDGDRDGDGFVEYAQRTSRGLVSQGWKDSNDSISHHDGQLAEGPIALCEVQGYTYAAMRGGAELARVLGLLDQARDLDARADRLRDRFHGAFWSERLGGYVLAL
ncbi:MAG TPA: glycogen debranching N-terminal domain-containing protein, partial [Kofleriaceae bacterium]|nr:glycogen debranching N-terminal domain-containing protein [Kofleriaceae bacterium]